MEYGHSGGDSVVMTVVVVINKKTKGRLPDVPICVNIMVLNRL